MNNLNGKKKVIENIWKCEKQGLVSFYCQPTKKVGKGEKKYQNFNVRKWEEIFQWIMIKKKIQSYFKTV